DAATGPSPDEREATEFFTTAARNLQEAGARAGATRMVVVSIIGIDKLSHGYNVAKLAHEQTAFAGPVPAAVLRAAQFHEFVAQLMLWGTQGDVSYVPNMRTQLVAARTVAGALADLATGSGFEAGAITEIAGPREESMVGAAERLVARRGERRRIVGVTDPSDPDAELMATGVLLPGPGATLAGPTFDEWLHSDGFEDPLYTAS
ncbi:MAG TPA: epimerase, partial [Acidimicrobiia bacterium]|nr:epimerase [Acidimicrobiia bacterium]